MCNLSGHGLITQVVKHNSAFSQKTDPPKNKKSNYHSFNRLCRRNTAGVQPPGRGQRLRPRRLGPERGLSLPGPVRHPLERTGRSCARRKASGLDELSSQSDKKRTDKEPGTFPRIQALQFKFRDKRAEYVECPKNYQ